MDIPPKPPDPPDGNRTLSQDIFYCQMNTDNVESRKRTLPMSKPSGLSNPDKRQRNVNDLDSSISLQSVYTHPSFSQARTYSDLDSGPFIVHVSRIEPDPAAGTVIRALKFGQLLHRNNVKNIVKDGIKGVGRNRVSVEFTSSLDANNFVSSDFLATHNFCASIPTYIVSRMGIVRGVPVDWSLDEFIESLELPHNCGKVLKARRLNKKTFVNSEVTWTPTQTIVLTFSGQVLPERIYSFHTSLLVQTYQLPTIQCHNCCRFGHVKTQCRSNPRCFRCAKEHAGDSCDIAEDNATCLLCSGRHFANNRACPEQARQKRIKSLMSEENISYFEASARVPNVRRPYSDTTKDLSHSQHSPSHSSIRPQPSSPHYLSQSYRKTVTINPRTKGPIPQGYDRLAHEALVANVPSSLPNGHALQSSVQIYPDRNVIIESLMSSLIQILTMFSDAIPPNVATQLSHLVHLVPSQVTSQNGHDGGSSIPTMEL